MTLITKAFFLTLCLAAVNAWQLKVVNNVAPCPGRSYCTVKFFLSASSQMDVCQGVTKVFTGDQIPPTGLGIQENGMYCRCCGNESGCINPDNAGMQLIVKEGDCKNIQLNDPFYCGAHPPNAKKVVNVVMSGTWPNCVATLTRKVDAPKCATTC